MAMNKLDYMARGRSMFLQGRAQPFYAVINPTWQERATRDGWLAAQAQAQVPVGERIKVQTLVEAFKLGMSQADRRCYKDQMRRAEATLARLSSLRKFQDYMRRSA